MHGGRGRGVWLQLIRNASKEVQCKQWCLFPSGTVPEIVFFVPEFGELNLVGVSVFHTNLMCGFSIVTCVCE